MIIKKASILDKCKLIDYLNAVQSDFTPPLFERIKNKSTVQSAEAYINKVLSNGTVLCSTELENITGIVIVYHNNFENKEAYIPLLSVKKENAGKGIAKALVNAAVNLAFESGMNEIFVKTWQDNLAAQKVYQNVGFTILNDENDLILKKSKK